VGVIHEHRTISLGDLGYFRREMTRAETKEKFVHRLFLALCTPGPEPLEQSSSLGSIIPAMPVSSSDLNHIFWRLSVSQDAARPHRALTKPNTAEYSRTG